MFNTTRRQLTAWYLIIIMAISILFSIAFYHAATEEVDRVIRRQEFRLEHPRDLLLNPGLRIRSLPSVHDLEDSKDRIKTILILINGGIVVLSGGLGYLLAGRTLRPIKQMLDEQHRFITDASHELRTPLTVLRSEMEATLLNEHMSIKEAKQLIASNLEEVMHLQSLCDNLLQLSQYKNNPHYQEVSLVQSIEDALKKVTPLARKKHITINYDILDVALEGDTHMLCELFVILLDNAIKYSADQTNISLASDTVDHMVKISITDQGMGIDKKDLPYIFDRFFRASKSRSKTDTYGFGLGLSIAKQIVDSHHGTIKIHSKPGKGTTFSINLPMKRS